MLLLLLFIIVDNSVLSKKQGVHIRCTNAVSVSTPYMVCQAHHK